MLIYIKPSYYEPSSGSSSWIDRRSDSPIRELTPEEAQELKQANERRRREEEEMQARWREEREARLAEYERLMKEKQEKKERAKEERRAQQQIKKKGISEELLPEPRQDAIRVREV